LITFDLVNAINNRQANPILLMWGQRKN